MLLDDYIAELLFLDDANPVQPSTVPGSLLPGKLGVMWDEVIPPLMASLSHAFSRSPIFGYVGLTLSAALLVRPISHWTNVFFHWAKLTENLQSDDCNLASLTEIESQRTDHCQFICSRAFSDWTREVDEDTIKSVEEIIPNSITESPTSEYQTVSEFDSQNNQVNSDLSEAADTTIQISFQEDLPKSIVSESKSSTKVPTVACPNTVSKSESNENEDPGTNIIVLKRSIFSKTSVQRDKYCDTTKTEKRDSLISITPSENIHKSDTPSAKYVKSFTLSHNTEKPSKAQNIRFSSPVAHQFGEPEYKLGEVKGQHLKFHATSGMKLLKARAECRKCPMDGKCIIHRQTDPLKPIGKCQFQGKILSRKLRTRNDIYKEKQRYNKSRSFPRSILQGYGKRCNYTKQTDIIVKSGQAHAMCPSKEQQYAGWNNRPRLNKSPDDEWLKMTDNLLGNDPKCFFKAAFKTSMKEKKHIDDTQERVFPKEQQYGRNIHYLSRKKLTDTQDIVSTKEQNKYGRNIHHLPRNKPVDNAQDSVCLKEHKYGSKLHHLRRDEQMDDMQESVSTTKQQDGRNIHYLDREKLVDTEQDNDSPNEQPYGNKMRHLHRDKHVDGTKEIVQENEQQLDDRNVHHLPKDELVCNEQDIVSTNEQQHTRKIWHLRRDQHVGDTQQIVPANEQDGGNIQYLHEDKVIDNAQDSVSPTEQQNGKKIRHLLEDIHRDDVQDTVSPNEQNGRKIRYLLKDKYMDDMQEDIMSLKGQHYGKKIRHLLKDKHRDENKVVASPKEQSCWKIRQLPKDKYLKASSKELCNALSNDKLYASLVHHAWSHSINNFEARNERYSQRRIPCLTKVNKSHTSRVGYHQLWQWSHGSSKSALAESNYKPLSELRNPWYDNIGPPFYSTLVPLPGSKTNDTFTPTTHEGQHGSRKNIKMENDYEQGCGEFCSKSYKLPTRDRKSLQSFLDEKEEKSKESRDELFLKSQNNKKDLIKRKMPSKKSPSSLSFGRRLAIKSSSLTPTSSPIIERGSPIKTVMKESKSTSNVGHCSPTKLRIKESKSNPSIKDSFSVKSSLSTGRFSQSKSIANKSKLKPRGRRHISIKKGKSPKLCTRDGYSPQLKKAKQKSKCDVNHLGYKATKCTIVSPTKDRRECKMRSPDCKAYKNRNVLFKAEKLVLSFTDLLDKSDKSEKGEKRIDPSQTLLNLSSELQDSSSKEAWNNSLRAWSTSKKNPGRPKRILSHRHDSHHTNHDDKVVETKLIRKYKKTKPPCYPFTNVKNQRKKSPQTKYTIKCPSTNINEMHLKKINHFNESPDYKWPKKASGPSRPIDKPNTSRPTGANIPFSQFMKEYCVQKGTETTLDTFLKQVSQSAIDFCRRSVYSSSSNNNIGNSRSSLGSSPTYSVGVGVHSPTPFTKQCVRDKTIEESVSDNPVNFKKLTNINRMKKQYKYLPLGKVGDESVNLTFDDTFKDDKKGQVKKGYVKGESLSHALTSRTDSTRKHFEVKKTDVVKNGLGSPRSKQKIGINLHKVDNTTNVPSKNSQSNPTKEKTSVNRYNTVKDLRTIMRKPKASKNSHQLVSNKADLSLLKQMESDLKDKFASPKTPAFNSCLLEHKKRVKKIKDTKESQKRMRTHLSKTSDQILSNKILTSLNALRKGTIASKNKMRPALATKKESLIKNNDPNQRKGKGDATSTSMATTKDGKSSDIKDSLKLSPLQAEKEKNEGKRDIRKKVKYGSKGIATKERDVKKGDGAKKKKKPFQKPIVKNKTMKIRYGPVLLKTSSLESLALSVNDKHNTSDLKIKGGEEPSRTRFNNTMDCSIKSNTVRKSKNRKETLSKSTTQQTQSPPNFNRSTHEKKGSEIKTNMYTSANNNFENLTINDQGNQRLCQYAGEISERVDKNDCKKESKSVRQTGSVVFGHSSTIKSESLESLSFIIKEQYGLLFDSETLSQFLENEESSTFKFNDTTTNIFTENDLVERPIMDHGLKYKTNEKTVRSTGTPSKYTNRAAPISKYDKSYRKLNYKSANHVRGKNETNKLFDKYTKADQSESNLHTPGINIKHQCKQQTAEVKSSSKSLYHNKTESVEYSSVISQNDRSKSPSFTIKEHNGSAPMSSETPSQYIIRNKDIAVHKDNEAATDNPSSLRDKSKLNNENHTLMENMKTEEITPKPVGQNRLMTTEHRPLRIPSDSIESLTFIVKERNGSQAKGDDTPNHCFIDEESQTLEVSDSFPNNSTDSKGPNPSRFNKSLTNQNPQSEPRLVSNDCCSHGKGYPNTYWINEKLMEKSPSSQGFPVVKRYPETSEVFDSDQPSPLSWIHFERKNKIEQPDSILHSICTPDLRKKSLVRNDSPSKRRSRISSASPVRSRKQKVKQEKVWTTEKGSNVRKNNESKKITSTDRAASKRKRLLLPPKTNTKRQAVCRDTFVIEIHSDMQDSSSELWQMKKSGTKLNDFRKLQPEPSTIKNDFVSMEQPILRNVREMHRVSPSQNKMGNGISVVPKETPTLIKTIDGNDDPSVNNLSALKETCEKDLHGLSGLGITEESGVENNTFSFNQHTVTLCSKSEAACIPISETTLCHSVDTSAFESSQAVGVIKDNTFKKDKNVLEENQDPLKCKDNNVQEQLSRKSTIQIKRELDCDAIILDHSDFDPNRGTDVLSLLFQANNQEDKQRSPTLYTHMTPVQVDEMAQKQCDIFENSALDTIPTRVIEAVGQENTEKSITDAENKALPTPFDVSHATKDTLENYTSSNATQQYPQTSPEYNLYECHINQSTSKSPSHSLKSGTGRASTPITWLDSRINPDVLNDYDLKDSSSAADDNDTTRRADAHLQSSLCNNTKASWQSEYNEDTAARTNIQDEAGQLPEKDTSSENREQRIKTMNNAGISDVTEHKKDNAKPENMSKHIENSLSKSCEENVVCSQFVDGIIPQIEGRGSLKEAANSEKPAERATKIKYKENSAQSRYEAIVRAHNSRHKLNIRDKGRYIKTKDKWRQKAPENTESQETPHKEPNSMSPNYRQGGTPTGDKYNTMKLTNNDKTKAPKTKARDAESSSPSRKYVKKVTKHTGSRVAETKTKGKESLRVATGQQNISPQSVTQMCEQELKSHSKHVSEIEEDVTAASKRIGILSHKASFIHDTEQTELELTFDNKCSFKEDGGFGSDTEFYKREAKPNEPQGMAELHATSVAQHVPNGDNDGDVDAEENIKTIKKTDESLNVFGYNIICEKKCDKKVPGVHEKMYTKNFSQDLNDMTGIKGTDTCDGDSVSDPLIQPGSTLCLTNKQKVCEENAETSKSTDKDLESLLVSEINIAAHSTGRHRIKHFFGKNASKKRKRTRSQEPLISRGEENQHDSNALSMVQYQKSWSCIRQQSFPCDNENKLDKMREMSSPPCKKSQFSYSAFNDMKQFFEKQSSKSTASWKGDARRSNIVESKSYWKLLSSNTVEPQSSIENKDKMKVSETRKVPIDTKFESFLKRKEQKAPHVWCNPLQHIKKTLESFSTEVVVSENKHETLEEFLKSSENGSSLHRDNQKGVETQVPNIVEEGYDSRQSCSQKPFRRSGSQPIIPGENKTKSGLSLTSYEDKPVRCRSAYTTRCSSHGGIHISEEYKSLSEKMSQLSKLISFDNDSDRTFTTIKSRIGSRSHDSKSTTKNRSFNSDEKSILAGAKDFVLKFSKSLESENKKKKFGNSRKTSSTKEPHKMYSSASSRSAKSVDTRTRRFHGQKIKSERTVIADVDNCSIASSQNINFSKSPKTDSLISPRKYERKIMGPSVPSRKKANISKSLPEDMNIQVTFQRAMSPKTVRGYQKSNLKNVTKLIIRQDEIVNNKSSVSEASSDIDLSWADSTLESTLTWLTEKLGNDNVNHNDFLAGQKDEEEQGDVSKNSIAEYVFEPDQPRLETADQDVDINSNMYSNYFEPVNGLPSFTKSYIGDDLTAFLTHNLDSFEKDIFHGAEKTNKSHYDTRQSRIENILHTESDRYRIGGGSMPFTFSFCQTKSDAESCQNAQTTDKAGSSVLNSMKLKDEFVESSTSRERTDNSDVLSSDTDPFSNQPLDTDRDQDTRQPSHDRLNTCSNQKPSSNLLAWSQRYDHVHRHGQSAWFRLATSHRHCHSEADEKEIQRRYQAERETQAPYSNDILENHDTNQPEEPGPSISRDTREAESYTIRRRTDRHEEAATENEGACCDLKSCDMDLDWYKPQSQPAASTSAQSMSAVLYRRTDGSHNTLGDFPRQRPRPTPRLSKRKNP